MDPVKTGHVASTMAVSVQEVSSSLVREYLSRQVSEPVAQKTAEDSGVKEGA